MGLATRITNEYRMPDLRNNTITMPGRHVLTVADGVIYDSWDSGGETPSYYWKKER